MLRVPYPTGYYTKWMDGRIDDPKAGWKGKGLWTTISTRAPFHMETGKGTTSKVIKFQLRSDPLARSRGYTDQIRAARPRDQGSSCWAPPSVPFL